MLKAPGDRGSGLGEFVVATGPTPAYDWRTMKALSFSNLMLAALLPLVLSACLFKDPVFTSGFVKTDDSITGVWVAEDEADDMEKADLAACFKIDDSHYMLHYPARAKDGIYYAMQPLKVRDRDVLQVQALGTLKDRPVIPGDEVYTLIWIEKKEGKKLTVRPLNGKMEKKGPAEVKRLLEDPATPWNDLFAEAKVFKRITKE